MDIDNIKDEILDKYAAPHLFFSQDNLEKKEIMALHVYKLEKEMLLVPTTYVFTYPAFLAGLSEQQIEYISKNAPIDYKKELINTIGQSYKIKEIFEIAKSMDDDLGNGATANQQRVSRVMQYINDNRAVFQFGAKVCLTVTSGGSTSIMEVEPPCIVKDIKCRCATKNKLWLNIIHKTIQQ